MDDKDRKIKELDNRIAKLEETIQTLVYAIDHLSDRLRRNLYDEQ